MQNLRDKLLKAGLVSEDQAKTAETSTSKAARPAPSQAPRREGPPPRREHDERPPREFPRREDRPRQEARDGGRPQGGRPPGGGGGRPQGGRPPGAGASRPPGGGGGRPQGAGGGRPQGGRFAPETLGGPVPKLPPMPGSKAAQRMESKKQVDQDRRLRELVYGGQVPVDVGATVFYFMTRKGKLRRLELTEAQAKQLEEGALGVVERPEPAQIEHSLVPAAVAEEMFALSQKSVRFLNRKDSPIGFMSDDQVREKQAAEARGEEPVGEADEEASEASEAAPAEAGEAAPAEASAEAPPAPEDSSEPTPS